MATFRSLLKFTGLDKSPADKDDAAPSRVAIMSGGVITLSLVLLLLVV
jgi:hypothetical protein